MTPTLKTIAALAGLALVWTGCTTTSHGDRGSDGTSHGGTGTGTGTGTATGTATGTGTGTGSWTTPSNDRPDWEDDHPDTGLSPYGCGYATPTLYLSPDDSNSYASAALSRWRAESFASIGTARTYELFNYYDFDVPPGPTDSVSLTAEWIEDRVDLDYALQINVGAEAMTPDERAPMNLTLVLDTSCSMSGNSMDRLKDSCEAIAGQLAWGDAVSMVTWASTNATVLDGLRVVGPDDPTLMSTCLGLSANGGTDLHGGLVAGYQLADQNWQDGMTNRIVLISDGGANLGITDEELIAEKATIGDGRDIFMLGVGVGDTGYNDTLMDTVTDAGRGATVFVPDREEAFRMLSDRFLEVFEVAVTDVRLELDLPEQLYIVRTSAEEVSTDPADVRPQYLSPNSEMVFYNELDTPTDECLTDDSEIIARVTFTDATGVDQTVEQTWRLGDLRTGTNRNAMKGRAIFWYGEALNTADAGGTAFTDALSMAYDALANADTNWPGDPDLAEIRQVLDLL